MAKISLLCHIVFHPDSDEARKLAQRIHSALNDDAAVPGLRIPTVFCAEDGKYQPPPSQNLDEAERSFVIILADDEMNADDEWCAFAADLWWQCNKSRHQCLPIQLAADAWPLHERLENVNFVRAFFMRKETIEPYIVRRIIIELSRYLHGDSLGEEAPTRLFISHTKMDLDKPPQVVKYLIEYLNLTQPIKTWFDSGDIAGGSVFADQISKGIEDASLLCVLTDNYASREWCKKEILLAKAEQRPAVVIDALGNQEIRSFPYIGNLPVIRWNGNVEPAIDLLLKETLRHLYDGINLAHWAQPGDALFTRAPELVTVAGIDPDSMVLYPDPPLGMEEINTLNKIGVKVTTPLERIATKKTLQHKKVAMSMSESTDIRRFGFNNIHLEASMLELARYLLLKGATLVYGGHLGSEGYTAKLAELVRAHNQLTGVEPVERIENYIGWPLPFDRKLKSKYKTVTKLIRVDRPDDINESLDPKLVANPEFFPGDDSAIHRYAWARGMTAMRDAETQQVCARIVLGGTFGPTEKKQADGAIKEKWYFGRIPGVLEESLLSIKANQPVFLIGAFGGVPALLTDILEGRERKEMTWHYQKQAPYAEAMRELYEQRGDEWWDYPEMVQFIKDKGVSGINPLLSEAEHKELFTTRNVLRMVQLIVQGLDRM
jgi:hypothetical protein